MTQKEREGRYHSLLETLFPSHIYTFSWKHQLDVVSASNRFYKKYNSLGYSVNEIGLLEEAFLSWGSCKEGGWEHATKTLYQHLNKQKDYFIRK